MICLQNNILDKFYTTQANQNYQINYSQVIMILLNYLCECVCVCVPDALVSLHLHGRKEMLQFWLNSSVQF